MIIWLASYPRSGNTLVRIVLAQIYGYDTYSLYNDADIQGMGMADLLHQKRFDARSMTEYEQSSKPYFVKTHESPPTLDFNPTIYVVRDGRDTLVSHAHYRIDVEKASGFVEVLEGLVWRKQWLGGWSAHVRTWLHKSPAPFILHFEDLLASPVGYVQRALQYLKLPAEPVGGQLPTFEGLHKQWPKFFRGGRADSWTREMNANTRQMFHEYHAEVMKTMGYK